MVKLTTSQANEMIGRIEDELKRIGKTKQDFYNESGITSSSFSQWRTGVRTPSMASVHKIASCLGVSIDYLLNGTIANDEEAEIRQALREQPEMRILFKAGQGVPTSALLEAAAMLMKYKEEANNK